MDKFSKAKITRVFRYYVDGKRYVKTRTFSARYPKSQLCTLALLDRLRAEADAWLQDCKRVVAAVGGRRRPLPSSNIRLVVAPYRATIHGCAIYADTPEEILALVRALKNSERRNSEGKI